MMNIDRIKFAGARGAEIQWKWPHEDDTKWTPNASWGSYFEHRINPRDAELEYGPLSSAMRDLAIYGWPTYRQGKATLWDRIAFQAIAIQLGMDGEFNTNTMEWDFFALFLAEYLADQGL